MFTTFALLCPGAILLVWTLVFICKKKDTTSKRILMVLALLCAIYFVADGIFLTQNVDHATLAYLNLAKQVVGPMTLPVLIIYYRSISGSKPFGWDFIIWFMLIIAHSTITSTLTSLLGPANAGAYVAALMQGAPVTSFVNKEYTYYYICCTHAYNAIMILELVFVAYRSVRAYSKNPFNLQEMYKVWYRKSARVHAIILPVTTLLVLICVGRRVLGDIYLCSHPETAALFSLGVAITAHLIAYSCNMAYIIPNDIADPMGDNLTDEEQSMREASTEEKKHIVANFLRLMDQEHIYLDPTLTIDSLAEAIGTNRTYVSRMIRVRYDQNFREYINRRRITYAQQYLTKHPEALLEYVASECGYMSTSAFSKNFQLYVGMSPRLWTMNQSLGPEEQPA